MRNDGLFSVQRALEALRALGEGPLRVQDVAEALGKEKTQVSRTLKVLAQEGFVERDPETLRYRLGPQLFALAAAAGGSALYQQAPAVLRGLVRQLHEAAHLTVPAGSSAVTVSSELPGRALQAYEGIGRTSPLNCTSSGRALLLGLTDDEVDAVFAGLPEPLPGTSRAPRTAAAVRERLRVERARGHVWAVEEYEPGLVGVGAPVHDFTGAVVGAVNMSAPVFRLPPHARPAAAEAVTDAAHRLSGLLGAPPSGLGQPTSESGEL